MIYTTNKHYVYFLLLLVFFSFIYPQSIQEMQKMKSEYEKLIKNSQNPSIQTPLTQQDNSINTLPSEIQLIPYFPKLDSAYLSLKHFGYDFFTRRDTVPFWENLPTPSNYLLGPGDELVIYIWGETNLREIYTISREGKIFDERVGLLNLTGMSVEKSKLFLYNQFSRIYSTLKGPKPTTFMDISLGKLKSININFVGEVKYPGIHPVHPFSTLITGLIQAGGVDTVGSLRKIVIKRDGKEHSIVDTIIFYQVVLLQIFSFVIKI